MFGSRGAQDRQPKNLILAFRADGPFWADLVHLLAYPKGVSYIWPFRYDEKHVESSLVAKLKTKDGRRAFLRAPVIVAARFTTPNYGQHLLPLRQATLDHVDVSAGFYSFQFRLGDAYDFQGNARLVDCVVQTSKTIDLLAFDELIAPPRPIAQGELLGVSWKALATLIAKDQSLPINGEARSSLFIHVGPIADENDKIPLSCIEESEIFGDVYGLKLKEGQTCRLTYTHYVPALEGLNTTVRDIDIDIASGTKGLEVGIAQAKLIGNYGIQTTLLNATQSTSIPHTLYIGPKQKALRAQDGKSRINVHRMELRVAVVWSLRHWLWRKATPAMGLFAVLLVLGAAKLGTDNLKDFVDGTLTWAKIAPSLPLIIILLLAAAAGTFLVGRLSGKTDSE